MKKRIISLLIALVMCISLIPATPAQAYTGNEAMSSGDASVVEAIMLNLMDYAVRVAEEETDITLTISDPDELFVDSVVETALMAVPGYGPALSKVYSYTKMTAEAAWELGEALAEANSARRELLDVSLRLALTEQRGLVELATAAYQLGAADYAKGNWQPPQLGYDAEAQMADTLQILRENANHIIFLLDFKSKNSINAAADALEELAESLPSVTEMYQIGYDVAALMDTSSVAPVPSGGYDAGAAVAYAAAHWNDGKGLSAEFVCDCLAAGGITIPNKSYFKSGDASYNNCDGNLGAYVNPYIAVPALLKYLGEVAGYTVIANPKESQMEVGDVVCMYPSEIGKNPDGHVVIITKVENGEAYFSAHNTDRHNRGISESWCSYLIKMNGKVSGSAGNTEIPEAPGNSYNVSAAISYADKHWNDGKGLCAEFVCDCLAAGGITIPNKSYFKSGDASYNNCDGNLGAYVNPYIAVPALLKYLGEVAGYTVIANPKESQMEVGDVVCMYPSEIGKNPDGHVVIITKVENGEAYFSAHNTDRHNRDISESWCSYLIKMNGKVNGSAENTKTQYRYHTYVNGDGARYICPYWGQRDEKYLGTTFTIRYTEWLDEPLPVDNGGFNYFSHPRDERCAQYGCIDATYNGDRYRDANGLTWYYQETRQVEDTAAVELEFSDVEAGAYYEEPVQWAVSKNITVGTSATAFSPQNLCTRAQIITFLWRAVGSPKATTSNPFTDVKAGDYYYDAAIWAYQKGMVSGTTFAGNTPCTRAYTVIYLWKNAGAPATQTTNVFIDVLADSEYAQAVAWAVANGVTAGTSSTTFSPDNTCTRGQIVTFLYRCLMK